MMKKGIESTEFWMSFVMGLLVAVLGVFVANGLLSAEDSDLIVQLARVLVLLVVPVVMGWITTRYNHGRVVQKLQVGDVAYSKEGMDSSPSPVL